MITLGPICRDERRRADILAHPTLNGIDFVEYDHGPPHLLVVNFLKPLPDPPHSDPDGAYGLTTQPEVVIVSGGTRIVGIRVVQVALVDDHLEIEVDNEGDFSDYELLVGWIRDGSARFLKVVDALDEAFSRILINFKAGCPVDFDCRPVHVCPPELVDEPLLDHLAKDYASFRQLLIDRIPLLNPDWLERNPADLGIALLELLAYEGDRLSYFQDAVANELYLDTARQRVSAKRHARLIDYAMHDGRNAWTHLHVAVEDPGAVLQEIPQGTQVLSRVTRPLAGQSTPPGPVILQADLPEEAFGQPALTEVRIFETTFPARVAAENNEIFLHTWGDLECCLARGSTTAHLYSIFPASAGVAVRPVLEAGDFLLLEEVKGPTTGDPADADPTHRQVVQLLTVEETEDPAYGDHLPNGALQVWQTGDTPLPLLEVSWRTTDALSFALCLSTRPPGKDANLNVSVARGNMILVDHGRTIHEVLPQPEPVPPDQPFRLRLMQGPMTMQCQPDRVEFDSATGAITTPRRDLSCSIREAKPAISLLAEFATGIELWRAVPHLLDSPPFEPHFVADLDHRGRAELRFGDGEYGREAAGAMSFTAVYRIGNGRAGNVGAEALAHLVRPAAASQWPESILAVRNPIAARAGADPETVEEVRQLAPAAFRAEQFRAVTEGDYIAAARKLPSVAEAVATFRWTGSWYTVFVGIDPRNPNDLITEPGGRTRLTPAFERSVRAFLTRYRLAGYDMEILSGQYVPLEIELHVCVLPAYFRADVAEAVRWTLSNRINRDNTRGFFHPDNFTFGDAVYISRLYAAIEAVQGVDAVVALRFQRYGKLANGELESGVLPIGPWEIARLDNDPSFMENGVLHIHADGGK